MSWLCWMGFHAWEWRWTRYEPGPHGQLIPWQLYRCKRCETGRLK